MGSSMLAHRYHIWDWGDMVSRPGESKEIHRVGVVTLAKRDRASKYEIFNELVSMYLRRCIGLPIPMGVVLEKTGNPYYASFKVGIIGTAKLPDGDLEAAIKGDPDMCCGTVVFDAWTANVDRHAQNYWYDHEEDKLHLFDHGCALLNRIGVKHLLDNEDRIAINIDNHDMVGVIVSMDTFDDWMDRILAIPPSSIIDAVKQSASTGASQDEASACACWLLRRRARLKELFRNSLKEFPKYSPGLINPFYEPCNDPPEYYI